MGHDSSSFVGPLEEGKSAPNVGSGTFWEDLGNQLVGKVTTSIPLMGLNMLKQKLAPPAPQQQQTQPMFQPSQPIDMSGGK